MSPDVSREIGKLSSWRIAVPINLHSRPCRWTETCYMHSQQYREKCDTSFVLK